MHIRTLALAGALTLAATLAGAHDYKAGGLVIGQPWIRATPPGASVAGGFVTLTNSGPEADTLLSATLDGAMLGQIHESATANGVATMRPMAGGVALAPGATVTLAPGGLHIMFMGLDHPLKAGESAAGTLTFAKAGTVAVEFAVAPMGGSMDDHAAH